MTEAAAAESPPEGMEPAAASSERKLRPLAVWPWWGALFPSVLAAGLMLVAVSDPALVEERYSRGLYPVLAAVFAWWSEGWAGMVPPTGLDAGRMSLSEATVLAGVLFLGLRCVRAMRASASTGLRFLVRTAGWLYLGFILLWGLNHTREPLAVCLGIRTAPVAAEEQAALARELGGALSDELAGLAGSLEDRDFAQLAVDAWASRLEEEPDLGWCMDPQVRAPLASRWLTACGISGIFGPHTQECHVAAGLPPVERGFVACHEIAHAQGWAREDEANFLAWRVASRSSSAALRVSGLALALVHVHAALRRADPDLQRECALALAPAAVSLLDERGAFWRGATVDSANRVAKAVNDTYLRSHGHGGVASYGRMVDLLVAERRAR